MEIPELEGLFQLDEYLESILLMIVVCIILSTVKPRQQLSTPFQGEKVVKSWLEKEDLLSRAVGMRRATFLALLAWIQLETPLRDRRCISVEERLVIFLFICRHGGGFRYTQLTFSHLNSTISRAFHEILRALVVLHFRTVQQPTELEPIPREILIKKHRFWPYFQGCVGALDGTHIHAFLPVSKAGAWRNRKGFLSQNVLAACSFDLKFTFIHAGWEGSAHDVLVLKDAVSKKRFIPPSKRFYLADAGYTYNEYLLTPYGKTRYHLREFLKVLNRPKTKEELFNLRHASLRNVIERIFSILKRNFKILQTTPKFTIKV